MSAPARRCLSQPGVRFDSSKTARRITPEDYGRFDRIVFMDRSNLRLVQRSIPDDPEGKFRMMMSYAGKNSNSDGCSFEGNKVKVGKTDYTRDLAIDIKGKDSFAWTEGSGLEFKYPVRIRQYGATTMYLGRTEIETFNNSTARMNEKIAEIFPKVKSNTCLYVLGTVKEAGNVYKYDGLVFDAMGAEFHDGEFYDPTFGYSKEPMQLSAFDAVVDVDGVDLKIRVQYPEAYKLVEKAAEKVKTGATVEFIFNQSGVTNGTNVLLLSPADIIVK